VRLGVCREQRFGPIGIGKAVILGEGDDLCGRLADCARADGSCLLQRTGLQYTDGMKAADGFGIHRRTLR
jgi:hypothetical protein